jgi:GWxTD domain-containing protein
MLIVNATISGTSFFNLYAQAPWYLSSKSQTSIGENIHVLTYSLPTLNADSVQVSCFLKIPNRTLQFIRKDTLYLSSFEITIALKDTKNEMVAECILSKNVSTSQFSTTIAEDQFATATASFLVQPGQYSLFIDIHDRELEKPIRRKENLMVPNFFSKPVMTTDLIFFHRNEQDTAMNQSCFPVFPPTRSIVDSTFYAKFTIYNHLADHQILIKKIILDSESKSIYSDTSTMTVLSNIYPIIFPVNEDLTFGRHTLKIELRSDQYETSLESSFWVQWGSHTTFLPSLDQAVEALYYIMSTNDWKIIKSLPAEEKKKKLEDFWAEKDPDPSTAENELEEEYYRRVTFTNEHFSTGSHRRDGWETDRGRIYMIYGHPTYVERPSSISRGPGLYEIWYFENIDRKFYFLDKFGSGDFRLVSEE